MPYMDPGYNVFNWRGEEGGIQRGNYAGSTAPTGHSWEHQADLAAQQRRANVAADEQRRRDEIASAQARANQYATASQGVGPSAYEQAQAQAPQDIYKPAGLDESAGYDFTGGGDFSPGAY